MANNTGFEIAVIGMSIKVSNSDSIQEFWNNLKEGKEMITFFSDDELLEAGVARKSLENPNYVKANSFVNGKEYFDSSFFGYRPEEAKYLNPQTRMFHQQVWEALENAGYDSFNYKGKIGLFGTASNDLDWQVYSKIKNKGEVDEFTFSNLISRNYMCTSTSYKLNLRGPSVYIDTACSSSLTAIHYAVNSLLLSECKIAVAGGVKVSNKSIQGYYYKEGLIFSPDGHCRPFDENSKGTIVGEGCGVVVLKKLKNALADNDNILAIIKGTGINNDGNNKVGYTAPSVNGESDAVLTALKIAQVEPESIGYIEAHGTGTVLGDPIEIEALSKVFGNSNNKTCGIGTVKSNLGHLDSAAGVVGFIKTVLTLKNKQIPPILNFNKLNPKINLDNTPFYVNKKLRNWDNSKFPLRAGVSSFGIGGTNVHVILEEAPQLEISTQENKFQLIPISGHTQKAMHSNLENVNSYLKENLKENMTDVAYTLQTGRNSFSYRSMFVCSDVSSAIDICTKKDLRLKNSIVTNAKNLIVFMFPGQGTQYLNMCKDLYIEGCIYKNELDKCFNIARKICKEDFRSILFNESNGSFINETKYTQPLLFFTEYALSQYLIHHGISPDYMIGHSIGEYTAACVSGSISLEETISLVIKRGELMQSVEPGSMLSLPLSEEEVQEYLKDWKDISIAAINSSSLCVLSGKKEIIEKFKLFIEEKGVICKLLQTSHAFHSDMMNPILDEFEQEIRKIRINNINIPYISNLSGKLATYDEIKESVYWSNHLRQTVQFEKGCRELLELNKNLIFIEVGPRSSLASFIRSHKCFQEGHKTINIIRHPQEDVNDKKLMLMKIGELWLNGIEPKWENFYINEIRRKRPLPTYTFDKFKYPTDFNLMKIISLNSKLDRKERKSLENWFYIPAWKKSHALPDHRKSFTGKVNLLLIDKYGIWSHLQKIFQMNSEKSIIVELALEFKELSENHFTINPENREDFLKLQKALMSKNLFPDRIIHMWGITECNDHRISVSSIQDKQNKGFYSVLYLAQVFNRMDYDLEIDVVANEIYAVDEDERIIPEKTTVLGAIETIPLEYKNVSCKCIDIFVDKFNENEIFQISDLIDKELRIGDKNKHIAYRKNKRRIRYFEPIEINETNSFSQELRENQVVLITGGLGGIGFELAKYLAANHNSKIILTGRKPLTKELNSKISSIKGEVIYLQVDVSDTKELKEKIDFAEKKVGKINGIIHSAGIADYGGIVQNRNKAQIEEIFSPKIYGTIVLDEIIKGRSEFEFLILCSSLTSELASFGQVGYVAANIFQNSYAHYSVQMNNVKTISLGWEAWKETGMAVNAIKEKHPNNYEKYLINGLNTKEGCEVFSRALKNNFRNLLISVFDLNDLINDQINLIEREYDITDNQENKTLLERPEIESEYIESKTDTEKELGEIWQSFFGIDKIGMDDNFFTLGGDSLKAITLLSYIHKRMGVDVPVTEIFKYPTIKEMALFIEMMNFDKIKAQNSDVNKEREIFEI